MKKLLMMMAMAVGLTAFAAQNDKVLTFFTDGPDVYADGTTVRDGECYALVWTESGVQFEGFNADGTLVDAAGSELIGISACARDGRCTGVFCQYPADKEEAYSAGRFELYLLDTRDANGVPSKVDGQTVARVNAWGICSNAKSGSPLRATANLTAAGVEAGVKFTTTTAIAYSDHLVVRKGERVVLVGYPATSEKFHGIDWNFKPVMAGETVQLIGAVGEGGLIDVDIPSTLNPDFVYEVAVLDTRRPDGRLSSDDDVIVRAWGSIGIGEGTAAVMNWHVVDIGESGTFYATAAATGTGKYFDFDPTTYLAPGYAAVTDGEKLWAVYALPVAYTNILKESTNLIQGVNYHHLRDPAKRQMELPASFPLDVLYRFDAFSPEQFELAAKVVYGQDITAMDQAAFNDLYDKLSPFFKWNADYEISFDDAIDPDTFVLAGWYDYKNAWSQFTFSWLKDDGVIPWVGSSATNRMERGETLRLLAKNDYKPVWVTYEEICTKVFTFLCGVHNLSPANWGKKMTVDLNLYENVGRNRENGRKHRVGTYKYTFKGPLNVKFYSDDVELVELAINTNHDGRTEFALPTYATGDPQLAFTGWTNKWGKVVATIPILVREATEKTDYVKTWYAGDEDTLELYATFKAATTISIKPTEDTPTEKKVAFKVTDEWLSANGLAKTEEALEAPQGAAERPAWQNYLLGMDPDADLKVEKTNGNEDDKALVVSTVQVVAPDAGIKVGYSLDKVDAKEDVEKPGDEQVTKDLKIDLEPADDTPTGYYKMNVIFTPTENGEEREKITIPADNTIGVLKVETQEPVVPVAVPWSSLEDGTDIPVNEIVKTSTLTEGDLMHVYDQDQKAYVNLKLDANGEWTPVKAYKLDDVGKVTDTTIDINKIDTKKVTRGSSVWLERKDTSKPFYLIGQYKKGVHATTQIKTKAAGAVKPEANLIAPPGIEDTDLNEVVNKDIGEKDQLMIVKEGVPTYFQRRNGKWSYPKQIFTVDEKGRARTTTTWVDNEAIISAGLGLWYLSDSGTPKITWPEPTDVQGENK